MIIPRFYTRSQNTAMRQIILHPSKSIWIRKPRTPRTPYRKQLRIEDADLHNGNNFISTKLSSLCADSAHSGHCVASVPVKVSGEPAAIASMSMVNFTSGFHSNPTPLQVQESLYSPSVPIIKSRGGMRFSTSSYKPFVQTFALNQ